MIITFANDATLNAWGKDNSVIGQPFDDALPELHNQPFLQLLNNVYDSGITYHSSNDRADLFVDGKLQTYYFKFTYQCMRDARGVKIGVLCFATDVTELEESRQTVLNSQKTLFEMVKQAPVAICILNGDDLVIQLVNEMFLEVAGKKRSEIENRYIWDGIPEASNFYGPILEEVKNTGIRYYAKEHEHLVIRNGVEEMLYVDFVYEPLIDFTGKVNSIMIIGIEITDKVIARRRIEEAEERARLAVEAAEIGTFDVDMVHNSILTSTRLDTIFGFDHPVSRDEFKDAIHPEDLASRIEAYAEAEKSGKLFYEARVIWKDKSVHWIRVQGKLYSNTEGKSLRLLGTVLDITEFKRLQNHKDDFISVASHELKTPMTSIKASIQLLNKVVKTDPTSARIPFFIDKASTSLSKMQHLIESLLNVSKITAKQLALHKTHFKVADLISECCDHVRMEGKFELVLTGDLSIEVFADRYQIDQVLVNMVNNAVKYSDQTNRIILHISKESEMAKISIQDFGIGISADKLPYLFDRYYRADPSGVQYAGMGLGLYISADIIERHGGKIGVTSELGMGSTFWFTLPPS